MSATVRTRSPTTGMAGFSGGGAAPPLFPSRGTGRSEQVVRGLHDPGADESLDGGEDRL